MKLRGACCSFSDCVVVGMKFCSYSRVTLRVVLGSRAVGKSEDGRGKDEGSEDSFHGIVNFEVRQERDCLGPLYVGGSRLLLSNYFDT